MNFKKTVKNLTLTLLGLDPGFMKLYYRFFYRPKAGSIAQIMEERAKDISEFYFLQIGGNDGFVNDPIFKLVKRLSWKGIIVEPQKEVFTKKLSKTYRFEKNTILENIAIAEKTGVKQLYKLGFTNSRWATGLATFNCDTLQYQIDRNYVSDMARKEGIPLPENKDDYIVTEEVNCSTIHDLLAKHHVKKLDLLQIDTEGFDYEIIKNIDFSSVKPAMISFENDHLSESDIMECEELLTSNGYSVEHIGVDSIALLDIEPNKEQKTSQMSLDKIEA
ncbi:FkbM family methyltransferase [Flagellimonas meridianipacifica]|uniref:FkbM family methyltransferase n=1 Tax=Flagellimonas meridianipacifica TaxID=1080225 RepID=A0A2T0MA70_9FLAO|nr:FkbM family methyltransferase [Allomuricauda pacifica]PRX54373.1 FkbM family methyltransferase [Allomuricauda pacifica]